MEWICSEYGGFSLRSQLIQIHKDYAAGIEAARKEVFSFARALNDYFHMKQNIGPALNSKLKVEAAEDEAAVATVPAGQQAAATSAATRRKGRVAVAKPKQRRGRKVKVLANRKFVLDVINFTRTLPTLSLFDIVSRVFFEHLKKAGEHDAQEYLARWYYATVSLKNAQVVFKGVDEAAYGGQALLLAGHWIGVFGTYPGTGSGSQAIESMHSGWEKEVRAETRADFTNVFAGMQKLYKKWKAKYSWGTALHFTNFPNTANPTLINSSSLRSHGRSTAKEFYNGRMRPNYYKVQRTTGDVSVDGPVNSVTTFYVMQAVDVLGTAPADATISRELANDVVDLVVLQGARLAQHLAKLGIIADVHPESNVHTSLNLENAKKYFLHHCVVVEGHLQKKYWPRYSRNTQHEVSFRLCTCLSYCQHAECEHKTFIDGLDAADPSLNLASAPAVRRKGRKRKYGEN